MEFRGSIGTRKQEEEAGLSRAGALPASSCPRGPGRRNEMENEKCGSVKTRLAVCVKVDAVDTEKGGEKTKTV